MCVFFFPVYDVLLLLFSIFCCCCHCRFDSIICVIHARPVILIPLVGIDLDSVIYLYIFFNHDFVCVFYTMIILIFVLGILMFTNVLIVNFIFTWKFRSDLDGLFVPNF